MFKFESYPRFVRQAGVYSIGWRNRLQRYGSHFHRWSDFLAATEEWSPAERQAWQHEQLVSLVESARSGTAYYASALADSSVAGTTLRECLDSIPILNKSSIRANPQALRNTQVREVTETSTSGSTGSPLQFGHSARSVQRKFAFMVDHLRLAEVDKFDPSVRISGRVICRVEEKQRRPWLYNAAENQLLLSSYHLNADHGQAIAEKLQSFRPVLIDGYPSGIVEALSLVAQAGGSLDSLRAIITTAETLYPDMRQRLERLSGVPVLDYYAASEGVPFIQQCRNGVYHVRWQSGIFEVDTGNDIAFEGSGELICTSFIQDRTPLIRYRTGDLVRGLSTELISCRCGLRTGTVDSVEGRVEDLVYTPDGRALGMFTYRTLKEISGLGETQVIQHDYEDFEVNSVVNDGCDVASLRDRVKASFERALGYPVRLRFNRVAHLPKGANGKVRLVISKVARKETASV